MHRLLQPCLFASLFLLNSFLPATDFSIYLPADLSYVWESRNIPEQRELWEQTPLFLSLQEVDWEVIVNEMGKGDDETDSGEFLDFLSEFNAIRIGVRDQLNGSMVFAVGDFTEFTKAILSFDERLEAELEEATRQLEEGVEAEEIEDFTEDDLEMITSLTNTFYFMADVESGDEVDRILSEATELIVQKQEEKDFVHFEKDGVKGLEAIEGDEPLGFGLFWSIEENILILGLNPEVIETQRQWILSPPNDSLGTSEEYVQTRERMLEDYHILQYFPVAKTLNLLETILMEEDDEIDPVIVEKIFTWLDADAMLPASYSFKFEPAQWTSKAVVGFKRECGLQRLLIGPRGDKAPTPSFTHKDFGSVSTLDWSLARFYEALEAEIQKVSPEAAGGLGMVRMMAAGELGFDYKLQFLDHLGDGFIAFQTADQEVLEEILQAQFDENFEEQMRLAEQHPTEGQYYLIGVEVKNEDAIRHSIQSLLTKLFPQGLSEPEAYRGVDIYYPLANMGVENQYTSMMSYTFLDNYLLFSVGKTALIHMAVDASLDPEIRFWDKLEYTTIRDQFPGEAQAQDYVSKEMLDLIIQAVQKGFIAGFASAAMDADTEVIAAELNKIRLGTGGKLSVTEMSDLHIETHTVLEVTP